MKPLLALLLTIVAVSANAGHDHERDNNRGRIIGGIIGDLIGGSIDNRPIPYPGHPGRPDRPGRPGRPGYPGHPGYPGGGGGYAPVTCTASDRGWEEHGPHYSCHDCLRHHGTCIETCSQNTVECQAEGVDHYGRRLNFVGMGSDDWSARNEALRACQYNYASNCYVTSCQSRQNVISRRSCR